MSVSTFMFMPMFMFIMQIDASAARTCFLPLQRVTEAHGVCIAYAGLTERMETLLR